MSAPESNEGGWRASLRRTADSLLGLAQVRLELFAVELQEEKLRVVNVLLWLGLAFGLGCCGLLIGLGALALWLWNLAGYLGLIGLALATLVASAALLWNIRRRIRYGPAPFPETIAEFRKDRACLRRDD